MIMKVSFKKEPKGSFFFATGYKKLSHILKTKIHIIDRGFRRA